MEAHQLAIITYSYLDVDGSFEGIMSIATDSWEAHKATLPFASKKYLDLHILGYMGLLSLRLGL